MNDIAFNILDSQTPVTATSLGLVHHQTKLDVFIIKAFSLLSNGAIINCNSFQNNISLSPQTANSTPSSTNTLQNNDLQDTTDKPNKDSSATNTGAVKSESAGANDNTDSPGGGTNIFTVQSQYVQIFKKLSLLYNATLTNGSIDERSTSPKSAIELFQRLQQIIREIGLSYDVSPYSRYFRQLDDNLWKIKSDDELSSDQLWQFVTVSILAVYNPQSGQIINQNARGKKTNSINSSPNNSGTTTEGPTLVNTTTETTPSASSVGTTTSNNTNNGNTTATNAQAPKKVKKKYTRKKNVNVKKTDTTNQNRNSTSVIPDMTLAQNNASINLNQQNLGLNLNVDASLPQILQKRLQNISQDSNSRSLAGYYTQPTSPGSEVNSFEFGLTENDFNPAQFNTNNSHNNTLATSASTMNLNNNGMTSALWKRRSLSALDVNVLEEEEEEDAVDELLQFSTTMKRQRTNNNSMNISNNNSNNNMINPQLENSNPNSTNTNDIGNTPMNNDSNMNSNNIALFENISKQLKDSYNTIVNEKDQRIVQLERELELQKNETQWLRKMLIEDMGCLRSLLSNLTK